MIINKLKNSKYYKFRLFIESTINKSIGLLLFQYQKRDNLFNWFYNVLEYQNIRIPELSPKRNYYEFGVGSGGSIKIYILALKKFCRNYKQDINNYHIFAFDSFEGLPEQSIEDNHINWKKGWMKWNENSVLEVIDETKFPKNNFHIIKGFYEKTLTDNNKDILFNFPPSIINIDCDYYSSTITVFKWINYYLKSGTIFRFDDIWAFHGNPHYGELKAINKLNSWGLGYLKEFPILGLDSYVYIYSKKEFEFKQNY
ncbi:MAG: TylF/MycF/NovP-related O-methyltransferase [Candidatus Margulisiibacteriota bacterium]|jgi:hypothetical protein